MSDKGRYVAYEGARVVKTIGSPNPGLTASNEDPELKAVEEAKRLKDSLKPKFITHTLRGKNNDELDPDPKRRLALERTIEYSEVQECEFCKDQIVYRTSDNIYSPARGAEKSILTKHSYPQYVAIDIEKSERDQFQNFQNMWGEYVPHKCNLDNFSKEELAKYIEHLNEQNLEYNRWVFQELALIRKQMVTRAYYRD